VTWEITLGGEEKYMYQELDKIEFAFAVLKLF